jgi:hypothetical protein
MPSEEPGSQLRELSGESERVMAELSITHDGRRYYYAGYRYDRLDDAVNYARLQRSRNGEMQTGAQLRPAETRDASPDKAQERLMATLSITFENGRYHLGGYRYDRLGDAVNYANLRRHRIAS